MNIRTRILLALLIAYSLFAQKPHIDLDTQGQLPVSRLDGSSALAGCDLFLSTYNPAGDGVTDDTQAFIDAIAAATTGDVICVPGGTYLVDGIDFGEKVLVLQGSTKNNTVIKRSSAVGGPVVEISYSTTRVEAGVRDLTINLTLAPDSTDGIVMVNCSRCIFTDLLITYESNVTLSGTAMNITASNQLNVDNVKIIDPNKGIYIQGDGSNSASRFNDVLIGTSPSHTTAKGFEFERTIADDGGGIWVTNMLITGNVTTGVHLHSSSATRAHLYHYYQGLNVDPTITEAMHLDNVAYVYINDARLLSISTSLADYGLLIDNSDNIFVSDSVVIGGGFAIGFVDSPATLNFENIHCLGRGALGACFEFPATNGPSDFQIKGIHMFSGVPMTNSLTRMVNAINSRPINSSLEVWGTSVLETIAGTVATQGPVNLDHTMHQKPDNAVGATFRFLKSRAELATSASDVIGDMRWAAFNSSNASTEMALIRGIITSPTAGSETAQVDFFTNVGGSFASMIRLNSFGTLQLTKTFTAATLPAAPNGSFTYCTDCSPAATCTGSGSGTFAFRINGAWACELN